MKLPLFRQFVLRSIKCTLDRHYSSKCKSNETDLDKCYQVLNKLVHEAGDIIANRNDTRKDYVEKSGAVDLVTETDKEVEKFLMQELHKKFPSHKFIAEEDSVEGVKELTNAPTWIIDPIDGTMNFVHGFPNCCTSIGLVVDKITEIGMVYNPILNMKFTASRDQGAFLNEKPIQVSCQTELSKSLIMAEFGSTREPERMKLVQKNIRNAVVHSHGTRSLGSAAMNLCMVAMGAADAYYEFGTHIWDICAGDLIVREAGGIMIDPLGGCLDPMSRRMLAASTIELAEQLIPILEQICPKRDDA